MDLYSILESVIISGLETRKIDLKREISLDDKPRAAKFAKTVSSLANTPGGTAYIVIGVKDSKERCSDDPCDYVPGFNPELADMFQRQMQQALSNNLEPVPSAELRLIEHPVAQKTMGVIQIARSFSRPHYLKKASGEIEPGVYIRRGGETFPATQDEIEAMKTASHSNSLVLNFNRALTHAQLIELKSILGDLPEVIDLPGIPVQFPNEKLLGKLVVEIVDSSGLTLEEWASLSFVVHLPGLVPPASAILAEIHGRSGHFPHIIRIIPSPEDSTIYKVTEIAKLQTIRDDARTRSTRPT